MMHMALYEMMWYDMIVCYNTCYGYGMVCYMASDDMTDIMWYRMYDTGRMMYDVAYGVIRYCINWHVLL